MNLEHSYVILGKEKTYAGISPVKRVVPAGFVSAIAK